MKVLHTSDWHLGVKLDNQYRDDEHRVALNWLSNLIKEEEVEILIIAGDIFDVYTPSNSAQGLYYNFLKSLINTSCQHVIIVAGNHDSPNLLAAAKELLQLLNIHIVANVSQDLSKQIIPLHDRNTNELKAVVAAVPYLTEAILRTVHKGEETEERHLQIKEAIIQHYQNLAQLISEYDAFEVPYLATGHLFVAGGDGGNKNHLTYLGFSDLIPSNAFPEKFDYIALGHLHKAHPVNEKGNIRYSGSLIPLDFNESNYQHQVYIIEFLGKGIRQIVSHKVQVPRQLVYKTGKMEDIVDYLKAIPYPDMDIKSFKPQMKTWMKVEIEYEDDFRPNIKEQLEPHILNKNIEILGEPLQRKKFTMGNYEAEDLAHLRSLEQLSLEEVFTMCMDAQQVQDEQKQAQLKADFQALQEWWKEEARNR